MSLGDSFTDTRCRHTPVGYVLNKPEPYSSEPNEPELWEDGKRIPGLFAVCQHCRCVYFEEAGE